MVSVVYILFQPCNIRTVVCGHSGMVLIEYSSTLCCLLLRSGNNVDCMEIQMGDKLKKKNEET